MSNVLDISIDQGSSLDHAFILTTSGDEPFDLTGFDARLQVRRTYGDTNTLVNCTLANGKLVMSNLTGGIVTLKLAAADTSSIKFNEKDDELLECVYDLEIQAATGTVYKPARGTLTMRREVTR